MMHGDTAQMVESIKDTWTKEYAKGVLPGTQLVLYVMAGGGMIGRLYAEQPADAYRDARAGRAPYKVREVERMRRVLVALAEKAGLNPHSLPQIQRFHAAGVF